MEDIYKKELDLTKKESSMLMKKLGLICALIKTNPNL